MMARVWWRIAGRFYTVRARRAFRAAAVASERGFAFNRRAEKFFARIKGGV